MLTTQLIHLERQSRRHTRLLRGPAPTKTDGAWVSQAAPLLAHAGVYADNSTRWIPGSSDFVELTLTPRVSSTASSEAETT